MTGMRSFIFMGINLTPGAKSGNAGELVPQRNHCILP